MTKNIYLDIGTNSLFYIKEFLDKNPDKEWEIHLFEPSEISIDRIEADEKIGILEGFNFTLHPFAVFDENVKRMFYQGGRAATGSSLFFEKGYMTKPVIEVSCIDFNEWVINNLSKDDYIVMNMDIEGAEYVVLPHLIKNGTIKYFNKMIIEFHAKKFRGENKDKFGKIHLELKKYFADNVFKESIFFHL